MRILLIGPLPPPFVSGATIPFKYMCEALEQNDQIDEVRIISTGRGNKTYHWGVNINTAIRTLWLTFRNARDVDIISFFASRRGVMLYGPIIFLVSRLFNKPLIIRWIGGGFDRQYERLNKIGRWIINKTVFKADACLLEMKQLVDFLQQQKARKAMWFPNYAPLVDISRKNEREQCSKFVFLGRIVKTKGIDIILDTAPYLMPDISVDIYGSLDDVSYTAEFINSRGQSKIRYRGILNTEQVQDKLFDYDALILPTFYEGEGYPAVILEAYSHGVPVITTKWRSIPEIVDKKSGILIAPKSSIELTEAMNRLSNKPELFQRLQQGAMEKGAFFSVQYWSDKFVELCQELVEKK